MKEILEPVKNITLSPREVREVYDASYHYIVYIVSSNQNQYKGVGTGVAILVPLPMCQFGFIYHKNILHANLSDPKFKEMTVTKSVTSALKAQKKVFLLEKYEELIELFIQYQRH